MGQPLDKQRAIVYGQCVQAAYEMYKHPQGDPLRPEPAKIPAGYELSAWIQMSDFILDAVEPKFYGIVLHSVDDPNSRIIAIRGTEGIVEWLDDAFALLVPFRQVPKAGRVANGFDKIYSTLKVIKWRLPSARMEAEAVPETFSGSFADQLEQLAIVREAERGLPRAAEGLARPRRTTVVTGHSLGGALTTLFVMENDSKRKFDITTLCTFASPRVGNMEFVRRFDQLSIDSWRIVNHRDLVPKVPLHVPIFFDYGHVDMAYPFDSDVFAKHNPLCWHSMQTYLHWLDQALPLDSNC